MIDEGTVEVLGQLPKTVKYIPRRLVLRTGRSK